MLQVGPEDTLNSIALRFNITPNKLVQLNKLFARSVYTGQVRGGPCRATPRLLSCLSFFFYDWLNERVRLDFCRSYSSRI